jgi:hypothetical protein
MDPEEQNPVKSPADFQGFMTLLIFFFSRDEQAADASPYF